MVEVAKQCSEQAAEVPVGGMSMAKIEAQAGGGVHLCAPRGSGNLPDTRQWDTTTHQQRKSGIREPRSAAPLPAAAAVPGVAAAGPWTLHRPAPPFVLLPLQPKLPQPLPPAPAAVPGPGPASACRCRVPCHLPPPWWSAQSGSERHLLAGLHGCAAPSQGPPRPRSLRGGAWRPDW